MKVWLQTRSEVKGFVSATEEASFTITNATTKENTKIAYRDAEAVRGKFSTDLGWNGSLGWTHRWPRRSLCLGDHTLLATDHHTALRRQK